VSSPEAPSDWSILVKNTTCTAHNVTVTLVDATGRAAYGAADRRDARRWQLQVLGFGGMQIAHSGPPRTLIANVTSLSFG
jgi:hypothetical protein